MRAKHVALWSLRLYSSSQCMNITALALRSVCGMLEVKL